MINSEKNRINKVLSNTEIQAMITAIGTGIGDEFDIEKLRYHRIIVMTDADVDGSHIRTLILTFLYRQMPELVERGHVYIAVPPLYRVKIGNQEQYVEKESQFEELLVRERVKDIEVTDRAGDDAEAHRGPLRAASSRALAEFEGWLARLRADFGAAGGRLRGRAPARRGDAATIADLEQGDRALTDRQRLRARASSSSAEGDVPRQGDRDGDERGARTSPCRPSCSRSPVYAEPAPGVREARRDRRPAAVHARARQEDARGRDASRSCGTRSLDLAKEGIQVSRFKGLGEMNAEELWETTMDPARRMLIRVDVEDAAAADRIFSMLMGDQVEPRRAFIEQNAQDVRFLDV